jgi:pimeloyl-ACP methyl ester carboxylesterase
VPGGAGLSSRDIWIPYSERYSALLVAPEFSARYYPGDYWYNGGNMFDGNMTAQNKANWTYTAIEHIFDDVRARSGATQETYPLFGHSAGGQFVHRLATFLPEARFSRAVAANAGLYAMSTYTVWFPFGLYGSPLTDQDLKIVFSKKLIIMSGELDTDPNDSSLANFPEAEAQGSTRFERAQTFFETARQEAGRLSVPLNWEYHTVPGVGHSEDGMAGPSAEELFSTT